YCVFSDTADTDISHLSLPRRSSDLRDGQFPRIHARDIEKILDEAIHALRRANDRVLAGFLRPMLSSLPSRSKESDLHEDRIQGRSEEHTSELQSRENLVCRLLLEKK